MQVFRVFSYVCCKCFHLDVAMFCNGYTHAFKFFLVFCKCFIRMLQVFQLFRTYVASVSSRYCKSRSDVAHVEWDPPTAAAGAPPSGHPRVVERRGRRLGDVAPRLGAQNEQAWETDQRARASGCRHASRCPDTSISVYSFKVFWCLILPLT